MNKILYFFAQGVTLAFLFTGFFEVFFVLAIVISLFKVPTLLIFFAIAFDLAFAHEYFSFLYPASIILLAVSLLAAFVRDKFLW